VESLRAPASASRPIARRLLLLVAVGALWIVVGSAARGIGDALWIGVHTKVLRVLGMADLGQRLDDSDRWSLHAPSVMTEPTDEIRAEARKLKCPRCGAAPYTPCVRGRQFQRAYHAERLNAVVGDPTKENREHYGRTQYYSAAPTPL
jgi:predicted RNA-binding Zn-ribbon protein involved in translation (DUF1610 family)